MTVIFKFFSFPLSLWRSRAQRVDVRDAEAETVPASAGRSLASIPLQHTVTVSYVAGDRRFRRRLLEMGLTPGIEVRVINVAPLGDPLEIEVRASRLSIRRSEAEKVEVVR